MKLSELIGWLKDSMFILGDRDVYATVWGEKCEYAAYEIEGVMGGDDNGLVLNIVQRGKVGSTMEIKGKIDRWQIASFGNYSMGTQNDFVIVGLFEGQPYRTSPVQKIEDSKVYTQNSVYELGVPLHGVYECQKSLWAAVEAKHQ